MRRSSGGGGGVADPDLTTQTLSYVGSFNVSSISTRVTGIDYRGGYLYLGGAPDNQIKQLSLTGGSGVAGFGLVASSVSSGQFTFGIYMTSDGSAVWGKRIGGIPDYLTLSTPFDISSGTKFVAGDTHFGSAVAGGGNVNFSEDGLKLWTNDKQFSLVSPFDASAGTQDGSITTVPTVYNTQRASHSGDKFFALTNRTLRQYSLATNNDLTSGVSQVATVDLTSYLAASKTYYGMTFSEDGTKFFVADYGSTIYEFDVV
jgi:hypothetical protein